MPSTRRGFLKVGASFATVASGIAAAGAVPPAARAEKQPLGAMRTYQPLTSGQVTALLDRTTTAAAGGACELCKTGTRFDGTAQNPHWLG